MMLPMLLWLWLLPADRPLEALVKLADEAEAFARNAVQMTGREVLLQQALVPEPRIKLRIGEAAIQSTGNRWQSREIVSEYGFAAVQRSLHEIRQVVSVDGKAVTSREDARAALATGISATDDHVKQQMLRDFEKNGLVGTAYDFGQIILLFTRNALSRYAFTNCVNAFVGTERALRCDYQQSSGDESVTVFEGRKQVHIPLSGVVWFRAGDWMPLRVRMTIQRVNGKKGTLRDEASVDYSAARLGFLLPATVVHRQFVDNEIVVQNHFEYSEFHRFSVESTIEFQSPDKKR
jgi:hypothetical protein